MSGYPTFSRQRQIGEAGINAVASLVNDDFGWIFRRVGGDVDYGIDGYIDIVNDSGGVTGQSVAVQIKTGASYFKVATPLSFVFYGEIKHLNYYINLGVPVLIVLHDDGQKRLYWELFGCRRGGGWN